MGSVTRQATLGLRENWRQFSLLVVVSAFVGAMVGLERSVLPLVASRDFGVSSASAALLFIATFGLTKAGTNLMAGWLVGHRGRRWTLVAGWVLAVPVPIIMLMAPTWSWIVLANGLLGVSQGLTWSTTVIMKIDLVGPARRGLAMGLNEFAGYVAVAGAAVVSGMFAARFGLREGPAWLGIGISLAGCALALFAVRDTTGHAALEDSMIPTPPDERPQTLGALVRASLWPDARLFSVSQAGLVNNLNDGLAWGLFPLLLAGAGMAIGEVGWLVAIYPATWGIAQLGTGALSDRWRRKPLIVSGMLVQGIALIGLSTSSSARAWAAAVVVLGVGTALVYPTLLAAVSEIGRPATRAATVGVYRMWRDLGYTAGALLTGVLVDAIGGPGAIAAVGALTLASGIGFALRFRESPLEVKRRRNAG
jgi:MFS family permease